VKLSLCLLFLLPIACGSDTNTGVIHQAGMEPSPFHVGTDLRLSGYLLKHAASPQTSCADGTAVVDKSCYVATFDWGALNLRPSEEAALEAQAAAGRLVVIGYIAPDGKTNVGKLVATALPRPAPRWTPTRTGWYPGHTGWYAAPTGY